MAVTNIYQYLNDTPERLVDKFKLFSRRTNTYKDLIKLRNATSHILSQLNKSGEQEKFDYLCCLIYSCPPRELSSILDAIVNNKDLSKFDERCFLIIPNK